MTNDVAVIKKKSVTIDMADRFGMEVDAFEKTLRSTVFPSAGTAGEFAAFLLVCKEYDLNPITKEIYAFPKQGGGIVPIVSVDGWMKLVNSHPAFDGMDFVEREDDGKLVSIECTIYRKDRAHPIAITEYYDECKRDTGPWKMKHRMLRHKAAIQCARYAFGFAGIYDEDEGEKIALAPADASYGPPADPPPPEIPEAFANMNAPVSAITAAYGDPPAKRKRATKAEMEVRRAAEGKRATVSELDKALKILMPPVEVVMEQIKEGVDANLPPQDDDIPMPPEEPSAPELIPSHILAAVATYKAKLAVEGDPETLGTLWAVHITPIEDQLVAFGLWEACAAADDRRRGEMEIE